MSDKAEYARLIVDTRREEEQKLSKVDTISYVQIMLKYYYGAVQI